MQLIQEIFTKYGGAYIKKFGREMPPLHKKALRAIMNCRTQSLGGQVFFCESCDDFRYSYHSCLSG